MEGESKRDYPASILHQSPWYKDYAKVEDYFARFGLVMYEGEIVGELDPKTTTQEELGLYMAGAKRDEVKA